MLKLKPCLSAKNPYALSKHRYYELKHFCLQYPEWVKIRRAIDISVPTNSVIKLRDEGRFDKIFEMATVRADLTRNIEMVERVSRRLDPVIGEWIFLAVTKGVNYTSLKTRYEIPCGKDLFYGYLRKFYYMLSQEKGL